VATSAKKQGRRKASADTPALSQDVIVAAALDYIDTEGLETFSLRNLAQKLGVYPTAIYWYVSNRDALLAHVVTAVTRDVVPVKRRREWQAGLRDLMHKFREAVRAHPNVAPLIGGQLVSNAQVDFALVEYILATLAKAGLSDNALVGGYNTVLATLVGFTTQEFAPIPHEDAAQWQIAVQERLLSVDADTYPLLSRNMRNLSNRAFILRWQNGIDAPLDTSFELCLDILVAGIEGLAKSPTTGG
jgi:AcrR family transcriptional regulator